MAVCLTPHPLLLMVECATLLDDPERVLGPQLQALVNASPEAIEFTSALVDAVNVVTWQQGGQRRAS